MKLYDSRKPTKRFNWYFYAILYFQKNKKYIGKLLLFIIIITILFFPIFSGKIIGDWIKDFFGTIINIIKIM